MRRERVYNKTLLSNMVPEYMRVQSPVPGDWFMVAFLPDGSNKILQDVRMNVITFQDVEIILVDKSPITKYDSFH